MFSASTWIKFENEERIWCWWSVWWTIMTCANFFCTSARSGEGTFFESLSWMFSLVRKIISEWWWIMLYSLYTFSVLRHFVETLINFGRRMIRSDDTGKCQTYENCVGWLTEWEKYMVWLLFVPFTIQFFVQRKCCRRGGACQREKFFWIQQCIQGDIRFCIKHKTARASGIDKIVFLILANSPGDLGLEAGLLGLGWSKLWVELLLQALRPSHLLLRTCQLTLHILDWTLCEKNV